VDQEPQEEMLSLVVAYLLVLGAQMPVEQLNSEVDHPLKMAETSVL
jgi:hypothetical protein